MPKIAYIEKNFRKSTVEVINKANEIIERYDDEYGINLTLRQLYYQFVSLGEAAMAELGFPKVDGSRNNERSYERLGSIMNDARLAGLVDWWAIEDKTRRIQSLSHWKDPGEIIGAAADSFRVDKWEGQEYRPEVWIEKEALISAIEAVCDDLDVAYFACKGYVSVSAMWKASQRFNRRKKYSEQKSIIIHLGDHDPSGVDMTRDIGERQDLFQTFDIEVNRIALNMDQVEMYQPPPNPAKEKDSRSPEYVRKFGNSSWELDALEPTILQRLIRETVLKYRDEDIYDQRIEEEEKYKKILRVVERNWESLEDLDIEE